MLVKIKKYSGNLKAGAYNQTYFSRRIWFGLLDPTPESGEFLELEMIHPPFTCRDLLCQRLIQSELYDYPLSSKSFITRPVYSLNGYRYMLIGATSKKGLSFLHTLDVLNDLEKRMGFTGYGSEVYEVDAASLGILGDEKFLLTNVMVIKFPEEWCRNLPTFSLFTGLLRYLLLNDVTQLNLVHLAYALSSGGDIRYVSIQDSSDLYNRAAKVLALFIDRWQEIFNEYEFLGEPLEDDRWKPSGHYRFNSGQERDPLTLYECGINWLIEWVQVKDYKPATHQDAIKQLSESYFNQLGV